MSISKGMTNLLMVLAHTIILIICSLMIKINSKSLQALTIAWHLQKTEERIILAHLVSQKIK